MRPVAAPARFRSGSAALAAALAGARACSSAACAVLALVGVALPVCSALAAGIDPSPSGILPAPRVAITAGDALVAAQDRLAVAPPPGRPRCRPSDHPDSIVVCAPIDETDRLRAIGRSDALGPRYRGLTLEEAERQMRFVREATLLDQVGMFAGIWAGPGFDPTDAPPPLEQRQRLRDTCGKAAFGPGAGFGRGLLCGGR